VDGKVQIKLYINKKKAAPRCGYDDRLNREYWSTGVME
jgi:hypothetical protein